MAEESCRTITRPKQQLSNHGVMVLKRLSRGFWRYIIHWDRTIFGRDIARWNSPFMDLVDCRRLTTAPPKQGPSNWGLNHFTELNEGFLLIFQSPGSDYFGGAIARWNFPSSDLVDCRRLNTAHPRQELLDSWMDHFEALIERIPANLYWLGLDYFRASCCSVNFRSMNIAGPL